LLQAERELKEAFRLDPKMAQAAYNLCILFAKDRREETCSNAPLSKIS